MLTIVKLFSVINIRGSFTDKIWNKFYENEPFKEMWPRHVIIIVMISEIIDFDFAKKRRKLTATTTAKEYRQWSWIEFPLSWFYEIFHYVALFTKYTGKKWEKEFLYILAWWPINFLYMELKACSFNLLLHTEQAEQGGLCFR